MLPSFCLMFCALATAQPADGTSWLLAPHLNRGQELVYAGTYTEQVIGQGVRFDRSYRLENRVLVLDAPTEGAEVAFFTVLKQQSRNGEVAETPSSVRLELGKVSPQGKISLRSNASLLIPLDGPPTAEFGAFLPFPKSRIRLDSIWEAGETGRPLLRWSVAGSETVRGTPCIKIVGVQQSDDWDHPRADHTAWHRKETVWLSPRLGFACKVERVIEHREPAHRTPSQRATVSYSLESSLTYPDQLLEDCRREIDRAHSYAEAAEPYVSEPGREGVSRPLGGILARINMHLDRQPATPYREAMVQVKHRVEAALRGEAAPPPEVRTTESATLAAAVGQTVPDFLVPDLVNGGTARLRPFLGKPVVLVFYSPNSETAAEVLGFAQDVLTRYRGHVRVLGLAVTEERDVVLRQRSELHLTIPILAGNGLRVTYSVDATPKIVVLDGAGVLRSGYAGWGRETPRDVDQDLRTWLSAEAPRR